MSDLFEEDLENKRRIAYANTYGNNFNPHAIKKLVDAAQVVVEIHAGSGGEFFILKRALENIKMKRVTKKDKKV